MEGCRLLYYHLWDTPLCKYRIRRKEALGMGIYVFLLVFNVFLGSVSQVLLKRSADIDHENLLEEYLNALVISAYLLFGLTTILGVIAYREIPLSLGVAIESTSYIFIMTFGVCIFKEELSKKKIFSVAMIILGIIMCAIE